MLWAHQSTKVILELGRLIGDLLLKVGDVGVALRQWILPRLTEQTSARLQRVQLALQIADLGATLGNALQRG